MVWAAWAGALTPGIVAGLVVCLAYGLRLGLFLYRREMGNAAYRKVLATKVGEEPPVFVKALAWLFMGALYVCETAGLHLRLANGTPDDVVLWVGVVVMAAGAVVEAVADQQKSAQKAERPDMVATKGLFSVVRCPNYLGEMLFWTGVLIAGEPRRRGPVGHGACRLCLHHLHHARRRASHGQGPRGPLRREPGVPRLRRPHQAHHPVRLVARRHAPSPSVRVSLAMTARHIV